MRTFDTIILASLAAVTALAPSLFSASPLQAVQFEEARLAPMDPLAIGSVAPLMNHKFTTVSGGESTIGGERRDGGLVVVFTSNSCPWVAKWEDRYETLSSAARDAGLGVLMLNSNSASHEGDESIAAMTAQATASGYSFTYAMDAQSVLADAFGATRTPEVFIFGGDMRLIYRGGIDDNARDASKVESPYVMNAIAAYATGKAVTPAETNAIGCTIKRKRGQ